MPCSGDRLPLALRSASSARACSIAFGLSIITACSDGPFRSKVSMRARHMRVSASDVNVPASNAALMSAIVAASNSIVFAAAEPSVTNTTIATAHTRRVRDIEPSRALEVRLKPDSTYCERHVLYRLLSREVGFRVVQDLEDRLPICGREARVFRLAIAPGKDVGHAPIHRVFHWR